MERILPVVLFTLALTACGGSGGGSSPQPSTPIPAPAPAPAPNEAPTISGTFTLNAKAAQSNKIVLNTADKENDQLSFSIADKPDWISFRLTENQLELDFQPGFFDIDDYQFKFRISDGKDATEYDFNLVVEDNREKWQEIRMTEADTIGIWSDKTEATRFIFLENEMGIYTYNGETKSLSWSAFSTFDISVYEAGCFQSTCPQIDFFEMSIVAQEQGRIRVRLLRNDNSERVINLTKENNTQATAKYYIPLSEAALYSTSTIDVETNSAQIRLRTADIAFGLTTFITPSFNATSEVNFNNQNYTPVNSSPILVRDDMGFTFENKITGDFTRLNFNAFATNLVIQTLESGILIASADIHLELNSDLGSFQIADFEGLSAELTGIKASTVLQSVLPVTSEVALIAGKNYTGRIIGDDMPLTSSTLSESVNYQFGGSVFRILDDSQGSMTLKIAGINEGIQTNFTWQLEGNTLSTNVNGVEATHELLALPNGKIGMTSSFARDDGSIGVNIYTLNELTDSTFSASDYLGTFKHSTVNLFSNRIRYTRVLSDQRADYFGSLDTEPSELWKYESDGSISMIRDSYCSNSIEYDTCFNDRFNNINRSMLVRNYKLLAIEKNIYKFQYSIFRRTTDGNYSTSQSIRYFEKLPE
ncbi:hypothetical protein J7384_06205 [Endozoicomonas sp. G2_1]|uniref:hypothetical protein n=1 Tax=Endozoicomonas sp. G2_1 TaxID=2821091 RepID=UPI001ADBE6A3|nr:hypothetical protein [Endozoicomonas sp. G2_1]MBO9489949.1 hypothetical protein [Endozoicomonas sp. G2_1]